MNQSNGFIRVSSEQAWQNILKANPQSRWSGTPSDRRWADSASCRLGQPVFLPSVRPSFHITRRDQVFCMGSCFARHIEDMFLQLGFAVPSRLADLPSSDVLNKYNTFSILNELRWALEPEKHPFPQDSLIAETGGILDPNLSFGAMLRPKDEVLALRRRVTDAVAQVRRCRLVILTLGLVEAWYDTLAGIYLTEAPSYRACRRSLERYELHVLSHGENMEALEEIYSLLVQHGHPDMRLVLTVSPVPFQATFGQEDVVIANTYSKSTLRAVAGDFAHRHPCVDYIPTFESVMNSNRDVSWESDRIHVTSPLVAANLLNFLVHYLKGDEVAIMTVRLQQVLAGLGQFHVSESPGAVSLPDFEVGSADRRAFPAGIPTVSASSVLNDAFGPTNLVAGAVIPWHAAQYPAYPQVLEFTFAEPLQCVAIWLQAQSRNPDRAPTAFVLEGDRGDGTWPELLRVTAVQWQDGDQWQGWPLATDRPYKQFRLSILGGDTTLLTLQRVWFQPALSADQCVGPSSSTKPPVSARQTHESS